MGCYLKIGFNALVLEGMFLDHAGAQNPDVDLKSIQASSS